MTYKERVEELVDKLEKLLVGKNPDYRIPKLAKVAKSEATQEILHLIEEAEREASLKTLEEVSNKAVELHITDLEMKQHHTGVGWEDVIMADEITKMRLAELKGE